MKSDASFSYRTPFQKGWDGGKPDCLLRALTVLPEDISVIPNTYIVAHSAPYQGLHTFLQSPLVPQKLIMQTYIKEQAEEEKCLLYTLRRKGHQCV